MSRCIKPTKWFGSHRYELHHFSDASSIACRAVSYLRNEDERANVHCTFVMGKCLLAPLLTTTIPRLELLAAIVAMRLDETIKTELSDLQVSSSTYFWPDSTAVIQVIFNCTKRFPVFVANRMAEIEKYTKIGSWRYVPSKQNPADCLSRGLTTIELLKSLSWLCGPAFLSKLPSRWPPQLAKIVDFPLEFPLYERRG